MKRQIANTFTLVLFTILSFSTIASAQRGTPSIQHARIPFAFHVDDQAFPAGEYDIRWIGPRLSIQEQGGKHQALIVVTRIDGQQTNERNYLRFDRYGETYFFKEVWVAGMNSGHEVLPSKLEKELAGRHPTSDYALVALK